MLVQLDPWQQFVVDCTAPVLIVNAGRRSGKTTAAQRLYLHLQYGEPAVRVFTHGVVAALEFGVPYLAGRTLRGTPLLDVAIVDNAAYLDPEDFAGIMAHLRPRGRVVLLSDPCFGDHPFNTLWHTPSDRVQKLAVPSLSTGRFDAHEMDLVHSAFGQESYEREFCCAVPRGEKGR